MNIKKLKTEIKNIEPEQEKKPPVSKSNSLSSGSTLLNLALTNKAQAAFLKGHYYFFVGDSQSGKTFLCQTCFAEACINKNFSDYELIYDNVEDGCLMDIENLFGKEVAKRTVAPRVDKDGNDCYSYLIEDFYYNIDDKLKAGKPFIYVLDSMDALTSHAELSKFEEQKEAHRKGKETAGSYGDGKAKKNSQSIRKLIKGLTETGSILIIICQSRDNLGMGFEKKTRSGGRALRFYATTEIWTSVSGHVKKTINGKARKIATKVQIKTKKNRITGELNDGIEVSIYPSYGIDDIGSCIDFLLSEKYWQKSGTKIKAPEFGLEATQQKLIDHIEKNSLETELQRITQRCWNEIQKNKNLNRKKRYA